jgi:hypothetical protein
VSAGRVIASDSGREYFNVRERTVSLRPVDASPERAEQFVPVERDCK